MTTLVAFLALLGVLITVHELGHFIVAKLCGVRVLRFSIGFGPRLFGFTRGETEYRISVLPLGGYVSMYGEDPSEDIPPEELKRGFLTQPFLKKSAIAVAGPAANFILPLVLLFAMALGHKQVPDAVVGTVAEGGAAAKAGLAAGDRIVMADGKPIKVFADLTAIVGPHANKPLPLVVKRGDHTLDIEVTPESVPDPTIFDRKRTVGRLGIMANPRPASVVVSHRSPASRAGIKDLDRIVAVDGAPTRNKAELFAALDAAAQNGRAAVDVVAADKVDDKTATPRRVQLEITSADEGPHVDVALARFGVTSEEMAAEPMASRIAATRDAVNAALVSSSRRFGLAPVDGRVAEVQEGTVAAEAGITEDRDRVVAVDGKPLRTANDLGAPLESQPDAIHVVGYVGNNQAHVFVFRMMKSPVRAMSDFKVFGVMLLDDADPPALVDVNVGMADAARAAGAGTLAAADLVYESVKMFATGAAGIHGISGPIGIARMSGEAAEQGTAAFLWLMCVISVNLGIINLLPVPVLDGGHLLIFVIELVTRRKVKPDTRRRATIVGIALVGMLMVVALTNDILGIFSP